MGFQRSIQPAPPPVVIAFDDAFEVELAARVDALFPPRDPFDLADPCPHNAGGPHEAFPSCGDLVCRHCSKIW